MNGTLEEQMGVYVEVCLGVVSTSSLLWLMKFPGKGSMTTEFLLEDLSVGR